jgi:hypothetical protein
MDHIPANMRMAAAKMSNRNQNRFRLETVSSDTAKAGRIITVNLPENALVDLKSFKMQMKVACAGGTSGTVTSTARLPADASSLISRVEVYVNGVQVCGGASEYNTISRILRIGRTSREKDMTLDRALSHSAITEADADETATMVLYDWKGFLGECATRYLPTDLVGNVQIRITFAGDEVIAPRAGAAVGAAHNSADKRAAAALVSYEASGIFFTIDTIQVDEMYHSMLRERLSQEGSIRLNYKEYYSWFIGGHTATSCNARFSLSSGSIDKLYCVLRNGNHQTVGIPAGTMAPSFGDTYVANPFRFRTLSANSSGTTEGDLRYVWNLNNVQYPQFRAGVLNAVYDIAYSNDKVHDSSNGCLVSNLSTFHDGLGVFSLSLNHPGEPIAVMSGYDSKGVNSQMSINFDDLTVPTASDNTGFVASYSTFICAETTASLVIGLGRSVAVSF